MHNFIIYGTLDYLFHLIKLYYFSQGELNLTNTEVIEDNKNYNEKQIFVVSFNGEYNLLMEAECADDADDWILEIRDHIKYANSNAESDTAESTAARAAKAQSMKVDVRLVPPTCDLLIVLKV